MGTGRTAGSAGPVAAGTQAGLILAAVAISAAGLHWPAVADALLLERDGVLDGQLWRLWSGHLLHLDALHAAINIAALAVLSFIAARMRQLGPLLVSSLWMMPLLSASLLLLSPGLQWYAGLSGLLHACAAWLLLRHGGVAMWTGLALLAAKLAWEQLSPAAAKTSAFTVIHLAHLIGACVGLSLAWPQRLRSLGVRRS